MEAKIKNVAVVGLGVLGAQIALQAAASGYRVTGFDPLPKALDVFMAGLAERKANLPEKPVNVKVWFDLDPGVCQTGDLAGAVSGADLVIEAVPEDLDLKLKVWSQMDAAAPEGAILATNSSSLPVSRLEGAVSRPQNCLNLHFYQMILGRNMADLMGGSQTSPQVMQAGEDFLASLGLVPLKVKKESLGFCFNRVWRAVKKETLHMWAEGYVDHRDVDRAWMIFNNAARGPFGLMDAVGLDVVRDIELIYHAESQDPRDYPPKALEDMIQAGTLGVKTGQGFYSYPDPEYARPDFLMPKK